MQYIISGDYPRYVITADQVLINTASDLKQVMMYLMYRLEKGDSITWLVDNEDDLGYEMHDDDDGEEPTNV